MGIDISKIKHNYQKITYKEFRRIVKQGYFECIYNGEKTIFTIFTQNQLCIDKKNKIITLTMEKFYQLLLDIFEDFIKDYCRFIRERKGNKSVKTLNFTLLKIILITFSVLSFALVALPSTRNVFVLSIISYYAFCLFIKVVFLLLGILICLFDRKDEKTTYYHPENTLPRYTILIPMFKENKNTISQLIKYIDEIEYPKDKLEVMLVLEENDVKTKQVFDELLDDGYIFPKYFTKIWVPYFEPQTKPKACDVGCLFATGEYVVIYDAEDKPDAYQLLKAVELFKKHKNVNVLQGCLSFYNYNTNLLTELFNIEYNVWFKVVLKALSVFKIPIPLGGTSNHFRFNVIENNGFWDGFHVTEDLEIGIIVNFHEQRIAHLNSDTKEWCVVDLRAWFKQRRRWMKGYMLTTFMYMFDWKMFKNWQTFIYLQVYVFYSCFCFLLLPLLVFMSFYWFLHPITQIYCFLGFCYYFHYLLLYVALCKKSCVKVSGKTLCAFVLYPFYFILHHIATWLALFDIFKRPFYWHKTEHKL